MGYYSVLFLLLYYVNTIYGNSFKARKQTLVNKHKPSCEMCFILLLLSFSMKKSDHDSQWYFISGVVL